MSEYYLTKSDELYHYGVKGQQWGRRQYQNTDGSLTELGRQHYGYGPARSLRGTGYRALSKVYGLNERFYDRTGNKTMASMNRSAKNDMLKKANAADQEKAKNRNSEEHKARVKKAIKIGAAVAGTALVAYGAYKVSKYLKQRNVANSINTGKNLMAQEKYLKFKRGKINMAATMEELDYGSPRGSTANALAKTEARLKNVQAQRSALSAKAINNAEKGINKDLGSIKGLNAYSRNRTRESNKLLKNTGKEIDNILNDAKSYTKNPSKYSNKLLKNTGREIDDTFNSIKGLKSFSKNSGKITQLREQRDAYRSMMGAYENQMRSAISAEAKNHAAQNYRKALSMYRQLAGQVESLTRR